MCNFVFCEWLFLDNLLLFGKIGFLVIIFNFGWNFFGIIGMFGGKFCIVLYFLNIVLMIWFFNEWNVIILILLFFVSKLIVCFSDFLIVFNLLLMVMWIVWKICFVGCLFLCFVGVGIVVLIILMSLFVVLIGCFLWICLIFWVICFENFFFL